MLLHDLPRANESAHGRHTPLLARCSGQAFACRSTESTNVPSMSKVTASNTVSLPVTKSLDSARKENTG